MARRRSRSLEVVAVLIALFLTAYAIFLGLVSFGVVKIPSGVLQFQSPSDNYPQSDLILNCFADKHEVWSPLCVSPTGEHLVAGGFKKLIWIAKWNEKNQATMDIQDLAFDDRVESAAFSKDGSRIAVYLPGNAKGTIAIFDVQSRQLLSKWPTPRFQYDLKLVFSDDREVLFANPVERTNRLENLEGIVGWEISSGKLLSFIKTPNEFYLADFGFFGGRLLIAYERSEDYKEIQIYESEKPFSKANPVVAIEAPGASAFDSVMFSADGTRLAASSHFGQPTRVYNVSDGRLISELEKAYCGISCRDFHGFKLSKSAKYLATSNSNNCASLWSVRTAKELGVLQCHRKQNVIDIVFGPDDKTLITNDSHAVVIWDVSGFVNQKE